jgi:hypothetical protein
MMACFASWSTCPWKMHRSCCQETGNERHHWPSPKWTQTKRWQSGGAFCVQLKEFQTTDWVATIFLIDWWTYFVLELFWQE